MADAYHFFVSYTRADKELAAKVEAALRARGYNVWRDTHRLDAGHLWEQEIEKALRASGAIVVLWSARSVKSEYVVYEADYALANNKLIAVTFEDAVTFDLNREFTGRGGKDGTIPLEQFKRPQISRLNPQWDGDYEADDIQTIINGLANLSTKPNFAGIERGLFAIGAAAFAAVTALMFFVAGDQSISNAILFFIFALLVISAARLLHQIADNRARKKNTIFFDLSFLTVTILSAIFGLLGAFAFSALDSEWNFTFEDPFSLVPNALWYWPIAILLVVFVLSGLRWLAGALKEGFDRL